MDGNGGDDAQSSAPSESFHTIPIYNVDASSDSDSDTSEHPPPLQRENLNVSNKSLNLANNNGNGGGRGNDHSSGSSNNSSVLSARQQPPSRSYTMPVPAAHQRKNSDSLSAVAESTQTRPSIDEELLFEEDEESEEEVYDPGNAGIAQLTVQPSEPVPLPKTPILVASPETNYETSTNLVEVPDIRQRMDGHGLRPLSLLNGAITAVGGNGSGLSLSNDSVTGSDPTKVTRPSAATTVSTNRDITVDIGYRKPGQKNSGPTEKEIMLDSTYRDSSDLLPLTLVSGDTAGGLSFSSNYAYISPPFGRVISRNEIMSRVVWFSTLVAFNLIYASYRLTNHGAAAVDDGKSSTLNLIFLVAIPLVFLILYCISVTGWTYFDLRKKDFEPTFTVLYYSPLMLFSLFFKEKKRVDVSQFHEVNYDAEWWRFGSSRVRESILMTLYSLSLMCFVISDLVGSAVNQPNGEVSEVFKDFVPVAFMLVVFFLGFVVSIWSVVEALTGGGINSIGEGKKRLVGALPYAFKRKRG